jgi:Insertion element 4 transposase N-terminal/Transposase DDE domain
MPGVPGAGGCAGGGRRQRAAGAGEVIRPGVLAAYLPAELVDEAVAACGRGELRRRKLPARAVAYFVITLCLLSGGDSLAPPGYRPVMASLLRGLDAARRGYVLPVSSAFTRARQRLGTAPLRWLFEATRGPLAAGGDAASFALGLRLVAWDGSLIAARDLPGLAAAFGPATASGGPRIRLMTLIECGTRALLDAAFGPARTDSEHALAARLTGALGPGMLLLADRLFPGHALWGKAAGTGAHLLWRVKRRNIYHPVRLLPDGTALAIMPAPREGRRASSARSKGRVPRAPAGHLVRVIDYHLTITTAAGTRRTEPLRLITTLIDHHRYPAAALAALYARRWEAETAYGNLKSRLQGARFTLRSGTPDLARQELWALLVAYQALCKISRDAAATAAISPARISFTVTLRTIRDTIPRQAAATPATLRRARAQTITDILAQPLDPPRARAQPRAIKTSTTKYPRLRRGTPRPAGTTTRHLHLDTTTTAPAQAP